jgi:tetratricopeptide (TPR) repeat protein
MTYQTSDIKLQTQKNKSRTKADELRGIIKVLETRITKLPECSPAEAQEILTFFDQADQILLFLNEKGMDTTSEQSQLETVTRKFRKRLTIFTRQSGGPARLAHIRQTRQPSQDLWWWYADQILQTERKLKATRWLRNAGILTAILLVIAVIYQRFLAPDPAVLASYGHQQRAEIALTQTDLEVALAEINAALEYTPDEFQLYILKGVILDEMGDTETAADVFSLASEKVPEAAIFYTQRATFYLMLNKPELTLADTESALSINPDSAVSYLNQGHAYEALGDMDAAITSYEQADQAAERTGNVQLQAIARVSMSNAMQMITLPTLENPASTEGE